MPRLLAMLAMFIGAFAVLSVISKIARPPRPKDTWRNDGTTNRSRANPGADDADTDTDTETISSMPLSRAQSLRDALTGSPIDTLQSVWQCTQCQTLYNNTSIQALVNDNHGRCVQCNHTQRCLVVFTTEH